MLHLKSKESVKSSVIVRKKLLAAILSVFILFTMAACSDTGSRTEVTATDSEPSTNTIENTSAVQEKDMFSERELSGAYEESEAVKITLSDEEISCESEAIKIEGQTVTITEEGVYLLTGTLSDGQILIDAGDSAKIQLVLADAQIINDSSAAIYAREADKLFITMAEGTENALTMTGEYVQTDENTVDGVIFSKCDLCLNGTGKLSIQGSAGHGIVGKDDIVMADADFRITAAKKAVSGKDSVRIASGSYDLTAGTDAIYSSNTEEDTKGFIYVRDGSFTINAGDDGIHASGILMIAGGMITVESSYEGLEGRKVIVDDGTIELNSSDDGLNAAGGNDDSGAASQDPFASDNDAMICINGGFLHINADGDGIDSNGSLTVSGGEIFVEGPENNGNGCLDMGSEAVISGGTLIATGSSGMAVNFSNNSTQCAILQTVNSTTGTLALTDESGNEILSAATGKQYNSVLVSAPEIREGSTYILKTESGETTIEMNSLIVGSGSGMEDGGMKGGPGMMNGDMKDGPGMMDGDMKDRPGLMDGDREEN